MYYLRRFLGLREIILVALLFAISMWLYFAYEIFIALIFFGITFVLILIAIALFLVTGVLGYKHDFEKTQIAYHQMEFFPDRFLVTSLDKIGEVKYSEEHLYEKIEKIALRKKAIYIYAGVAINYYVTAEDKEIDLATLKEFLIKNVKPEKFKIKKTIRKYPKKKKIMLGED